jgi:hypothetical protein
MPLKYSQHNQYSPEFNPERCAASVPIGGRTPGFYQCQRSIKLKKDSDGDLWCWQHHPDAKKARPGEDLIIKYYAGFSYGEGSVAKVEIVKEAPKTYMLGNIEWRLGHSYDIWANRRSFKQGKGNWSDTSIEALDWLRSKYQDYIKALDQKLRDAKRGLEIVEQLDGGALTPLDWPERKP